MTDANVFTPEETTEVLDVQNVRKALIRELTVDGKPPAHTSDKVLLLGLLDGADRSVFTRAKLKADRMKDENTQSVLKVTAELLRSINTRTYRPNANMGDRILPESVVEREFVPGELDIGIEPISLEQQI